MSYFVSWNTFDTLRIKTPLVVVLRYKCALSRKTINPSITQETDLLHFRWNFQNFVHLRHYNYQASFNFLVKGRRASSQNLVVLFVIISICTLQFYICIWLAGIAKKRLQIFVIMNFVMFLEEWNNDVICQ